MNSDEEKFQEMHLLEHNLQNTLLQKQAFQMELSETSSALKEIEHSKDDIFKIVGKLMIKTNKEEVKEELVSKQKILETRLKTLEKQEDILVKKMEIFQKEVRESK